MSTTFDQHMSYNRSEVTQRQIDTLVGLCKGIVLDGVVDQAEAEGLLDWLQINEATVLKNPIVRSLIIQLTGMLEDNVLDKHEADELLALLESFTGGPVVPGELMKTTGLPLDDPAPRVVFSRCRFLFTGTFAYGPRRKCRAAVLERGGRIAPGVSRYLDYLVLGQYVTPSWKHESFGLKIAKAVEYRDDRGCDLAIISEDHWRVAGGI